MIATITGELDLSNAWKVGRKLIGLPNGAPGLIVDLADTFYLDSSGIALLCDLALRLRQRSQLLVVVSPPGTAPHRVLEITGLQSQVTIVAEMAVAVSVLQSASASGI